MNIVILDAYTTNPGDLSWKELESLGSCAIYNRTPSDSVISHAKDAEIVLTNKTIISRESIGQLPKLRYIGVLATGYNIVDVAAARARNIIVANVPAYSTMSVAQLAFAHLLNFTHHVGDHGRSVAAGEWTHNADFCYWNFPLVELDGKTMGVIGFGRIGQTVATIAEAFGMNVIAHRAPSSPSGRKFPNIRFVSLEELFRESDVVSLHCPLNPQTQQIVNAQSLSWMKPTAVLINTSRGPLVDEQALADALNNDKLAWAGLDVLVKEPPLGDNPLLTAKNCCITPHFAWASFAARKRLIDVTVDNIRNFLAGHPKNVVEAS
jgi:glycerate dehydrogenase